MITYTVIFYKNEVRDIEPLSSFKHILMLYIISLSCVELILRLIFILKMLQSSAASKSIIVISTISNFIFFTSQLVFVTVVKDNFVAVINIITSFYCFALSLKQLYHMCYNVTSFRVQPSSVIPITTINVIDHDCEPDCKVCPCPICLGSIKTQVKFICSHIFCENCSKEMLKYSKNCPICRGKIAEQYNQVVFAKV